MVVSVGLATGCSGEGSAVPVAKARQPFAGVKLKIACSASNVGMELNRRAVAWGQKTGATTAFEAGLPADADILIVPPAEMGLLVSKNEARPVPENIRFASHPMQWSRCLTVATERLAGWGGEPRGIPLAGEAYVLAYRADRFADAKAASEYAAKYQRPLVPPVTWEEFADVAEFFADRGQPSLPPLPDDPQGALRDFHFVAACYDRPAIAGTTFSAQTNDTARDPSAARMLGFHHDLDTAQPRLLTPAFREAAKWSKRVARCRLPKANGTKADPATALASGSATMAVLSLAELGQLPKVGAAAPTTIGIASLPGTKVWYDAADGQAKPPGDQGKGVNFIPYFGIGGGGGAVRTSCANPEAAFELLAELASLDRSAELISDPSLGFGPFRAEHLDQAHENIWQRYGFDVERSRQLANAIRHYCGIGLANAVVATRGADQAELMKLLAAEVTKLTAGSTPDDAMKAADAAWRKADGARPADILKAERRQSAGLR